MTPPPHIASPSRSRSGGIDIRDALTILSARASQHHHDHHHDEVDAIPAELRSMGQTIDMTTAATTATSEGTGDDYDDDNEEKTTEEEDDNGDVRGSQDHQRWQQQQRGEGVESLERTRARRSEEVRARLSSMPTSELLKTIFASQEERVATYRTFEAGLSSILSSGNVTSYPALCAMVTASFSVLSDTINAVSSTLESRPRGRMDDIISKHTIRLQGCECEKLNLTAALHLERLRLNDSQLSSSSSSSSGGRGSGGGGTSYGEESDVDGVTARLLRGGITKLEDDLSIVVSKINDVLEEMRCIAADIDDESE